MLRRMALLVAAMEEGGVYTIVPQLEEWIFPLIFVDKSGGYLGRALLILESFSVGFSFSAGFLACDASVVRAIVEEMACFFWGGDMHPRNMAICNIFYIKFKFRKVKGSFGTYVMCFKKN